MEVQYDNRTHTYFTMINGSRKIYQSCTTVVGWYKEPFNTVEKARAYAEKNGETPEYWMRVWAEKRDLACEKGTAIHDEREQREYKSSSTVFNTATVRLLNYHTLADGVYPELKLWHHYWCIAGRADKCTIETIGRNRYMHILDYKTNELKFQSYQNRRGDFKRMLQPLQGLMDCNVMHYYLQLSLYQYMAEYLGFKPGTRTIVNIVDGKDVPYEVPYLRDKVEDMLKFAKINKRL